MGKDFKSLKKGVGKVTEFTHPTHNHGAKKLKRMAPKSASHDDSSFARKITK